MNKCVREVLVGLALTLAVALNGCGGGGGGGGTTTTDTTTGTGSALKVAEKVSVVDASSSSKPSKGVSPLIIGDFRLAPPATVTASGTDYSSDTTEVFVNEQSAKTFDTINEILCMMAQAKYDAMVNKGDYKAQIDKNQCSQSRDSAKSAGQSSQNQSSGSTSPDYENWTLNSNRADDSSPHIVKAWIHSEDGPTGSAMVINAKVTITEGKSSTNPYGIFTMSFISYPEVNGTAVTSKEVFRGILYSEKDATGTVLLKFAMEGSFSETNASGSFNQKITLNRSTDGSTGGGTISQSDSFTMGSQSETKSASFNIAFNQSNFLRKDTSTSQEVCLSRTTFDETAWRYGLYDSNGTRVTRNSGFPIKYTSGGKDYHGWVGYWGLWIPMDVTVNDGDTIYKMTYGEGGGTSTAYTLLKKGGKLKKHTKNETTLGKIKNLPLEYMEQSGSGGTNYRVKWNGTNFVKFAQLNQSSYTWSNITEAALDLSSLNFGELNFWSQSLNGQVRVQLTCTFNNTTFKNSCSSPTDSSKVIFFTEDIVYPGDTVPSTLRCYDNCPQYDATSGVTGSGWGGGDPQNPTSYNYTFSDSVLKDSSSRDMLLTSASGTQQWGYMSGPLFEPTSTNLASLACDDWNQDGQQNDGTCGWKAWSVLSTYYTWETGPNQWNQLTVLKDSSGTALKFDAPLQVQYTHSQTDTSAYDYKYNGVVFYLEYSGFGELHGIPSSCVDMDTGNVTDCGTGGEKIRWVPEFMIPEGSSVANGTTTYYAKPLEKEQRMKSVAATNCSALTLTTYTLPDTSLWSDPALGTEPTVTNAPAVIGGVVQ